MENTKSATTNKTGFVASKKVEFTEAPKSEMPRTKYKKATEQEEQKHSEDRARTPAPAEGLEELTSRISAMALQIQALEREKAAAVKNRSPRPSFSYDGNSPEYQRPRSCLGCGKMDHRLRGPNPGEVCPEVKPYVDKGLLRVNEKNLFTDNNGYVIPRANNGAGFLIDELKRRDASNMLPEHLKSSVPAINRAYQNTESSSSSSDSDDEEESSDTEGSSSNADTASYLDSSEEGWAVTDSEFEDGEGELRVLTSGEHDAKIQKRFQKTLKDLNAQKTRLVDANEELSEAGSAEAFAAKVYEILKRKKMNLDLDSSESGKTTKKLRKSSDKKKAPSKYQITSEIQKEANLPSALRRLLDSESKMTVGQVLGTSPKLQSLFKKHLRGHRVLRKESLGGRVNMVRATSSRGEKTNELINPFDKEAGISDREVLEAGLTDQELLELVEIERMTRSMPEGLDSSRITDKSSSDDDDDDSSDETHQASSYYVSQRMVAQPELPDQPKFRNIMSAQSGKYYVQMGGRTILCLFDSGCTINVISIPIAKVCGLDKYWEKTTWSMTVANGEKETMYAMVRNVPIKLGGLTFPTHLFVSHSLCEFMLLGRPFERMTRMTWTNEANGKLWGTAHSLSGRRAVKFCAADDSNIRDYREKEKKVSCRTMKDSVLEVDRETAFRFGYNSNEQAAIARFEQEQDAPVLLEQCVNETGFVRTMYKPVGRKVRPVNRPLANGVKPEGRSHLEPRKDF